MKIVSTWLDNHRQIDYLKDLMSALEQVHSVYRKWSLHKFSPDGETEIIQDSYCERVFAYELYHQIRLIMEPKPGTIIERYNGVYINGEQVKTDCFFKNLFEGLFEVSDKFKEKGNKIIPDLVLHKDLGSVESGDQIYLVEIKMGGNEDALCDLSKLSFLKQSNLRFDLYVFVYVDKSIDTLKSELKKIDTNGLSNEIVCICLVGEEAICYTLGDLLNN